jgi:hypothetical protein
MYEATIESEREGRLITLGEISYERYIAFGKYSDPFPFIHILLRYSLILKWIFKKNPHQSTHNTPQ